MDLNRQTHSRVRSCVASLINHVSIEKSELNQPFHHSWSTSVIYILCHWLLRQKYIDFRFIHFNIGLIKTARRSNQSILKEISPGCSLEGMMQSWNSSTLATSCEELTHWKRLWCWEGLGAGEGDDRGWDGWMASLTRWRWVWVNSRSWWWTGRPGVLRFMGSQRVGHDWVTELNWTESKL